MLPMADAAFDCVISNGVINLSAGKARVFAEATRVLRPGGRLAVADIVSEQQLTDAIIGNAELWAACIGGATQEDTYRALIESAGLMVREVRRNDYGFISDRARAATTRYGVKSISLLAIKT
jgi:arsenite methyltransferase